MRCLWNVNLSPEATVLHEWVNKTHIVADSTVCCGVVGLLFSGLRTKLMYVLNPGRGEDKF